MNYEKPDLKNSVKIDYSDVFKQVYELEKSSEQKEFVRSFIDSDPVVYKIGFNKNKLIK